MDQEKNSHQLPVMVIQDVLSLKAEEKKAFKTYKDVQRKKVINKQDNQIEFNFKEKKIW